MKSLNKNTLILVKVRAMKSGKGILQPPYDTSVNKVLPETKLYLTSLVENTLNEIKNIKGGYKSLKEALEAIKKEIKSNKEL